MTILDDYLGSFDPDVTLASFSRRFLAVLGREWLLHGHLQDRIGMPLVHAGNPREEMENVAIVEWMGASPIYSRRTQRALNFVGSDVGTIFKNIQLDIGAPHQFLDFRCTVHDEKHGEFQLAHCGALMDVEPMGADYVQGMCHTIEDPTFDATAVATNPRAQVRPVHRPPRVPATLTPHCHWTVTIVDDAEPVRAHPNVAIIEQSLIAKLGIVQHAPSGEPGGWDDYSGPFDPDFELEDFSQPAQLVALQEIAVQSHLLMRGYLLAATQQYGDGCLAFGPQVFTGLAGITAGRLRDGLGLGDDLSAIAKVFQLHPSFYPRTYVGLTVELRDDDVRVAIADDSPALAEGDDLTFFAALGDDADRAFDAIARAVNSRASCAQTATRPGERFAYAAAIDENASPARDYPETSLGKISTGATVTFTPRRPVRA